MAAVCCTREIAQSFETGMEFFNTFGGNPVSCAVGLEVMSQVENGLMEHCLRVGTKMLEDLKGLMEKHQCIGDVRGLGLFIGIELVTDRKTKEPATSLAKQVCTELLKRKILISTDGPYNCVLKIKPPLVISSQDVDYLTSSLDAVLSNLIQ